MIETLNIEKLHPKIWVVKNALKQSSELINYLETGERAELWIDWYLFGKRISLNLPTYEEKHFPSKKQWAECFNSIQEGSIREVIEVFYEITKKYVDELEIKLDNWVWKIPDVAYYNSNAGVSETRAMSYHTDFQVELAPEPGNKFAITCLFYLNDDYDGGEIQFKVFDEEDASEVLHRISYKPSKGDVVIFPSAHPFYHGVKIANGKKYILRTYWLYWYDGDKEFILEKEKYSEEEWKKILKIRYKESWNKVSHSVERV